MRPGFFPAAGAVVLALVACNVGGTVSGPHGISTPTTSDQRSIQREQAAFASLVVAGFHYSISGRLSNLNVSSVGGRTFIVGDAGTGDYVDIKFLKIPSNVFALGPTRTPSFFNPGCGDDCSTGGVPPPTPSPQQTTPPNYNSSAAQ
jgi:hypothetical protein